MNFKHSALSVALLAGLAIPAVSSAQTAAPEAAPAASPLTGNLGFFSDYRFRGISQTFKKPAIQGGFDYAHSSGAYLGTWASNVSGNQYPGGNSMEWDFYGGFKGEFAKDVGFDVGVLHYYYAGANYKNFVGGADQKMNNTELYGAVSAFGLTAKLSYALSDYFGLNDKNYSALGTGGSKGTTYFDLTYSAEVAPKLTLTAHAGRTNYRHFGKLNYTDYKLGLGYDVNGYVLGAAVVGNSGLSADGKAFNTGATPSGETKQLYKTGLVLSVSKTF